MNYLDGNKKCLAEILDAVTPEDEKNSFLILEYVKNYTGIVIGPIHEDGYGNTFELFYTKMHSDLDEIYNWDNFKEAKKQLNKLESPHDKIFHLKKGIKIAFEHEMMLPDCEDEGPKPRWVELYGEWYTQMGDYRMAHATEEELKWKADFIQGLIGGTENALKKYNNN
mgnify:CR=1 FL=1